LAPESFTWLLGSLCRIQRLPFDARLLVQRFPGPYGLPRLLAAAQALGFRAGEVPLTEASLRAAHFPCVAFLKADPNQPAILVKVRGDELLYFEPGGQSPRTCAIGAIGETFEPRLLLLRHEEATAKAEDGAAAAPAFGFGWFARELLRHRGVWRDVLLASLFIQLVGLATPVFTQVVIDKVVVHQTLSTLAVIAAALAMLLVFNAAMSWLRQYLVLHTGNRVDAVLGSQVFAHLLRLHLPYFEARPTGTLVARLRAVETIREFMASAAVSVALDFPFLIVFVAVMFAYSWQLTLIALALLGLVTLVSVLVTPLLRARLNRQFLLGARNQAFLTEYVAGMETVKSLQMEPRLEARYDELLAAYLASGFATRQLSNGTNVIANALEQAMTLALLCVGALLVMRNEGFTIGMLVAFQMFAGRMSQPLLRLASLWQEFQNAAIAVKRLGDIMDAPAEPQTLAPSRAAYGRGEIRVRDLSFRYSPERPWLFRNLTLAIQPGRLTVLSGPSGSGKSTLAKLLMGFYQPSDGSLAIDGTDLRHLPANELRAHFGVVPQETRLFSGTIYENLVAAQPNASLEDVVRACAVAEIHETIERLPQGYQTEIGEQGVGLSGGQKQRIAIARAVLKRAPVLVFDEATSNLDAQTAERFAQTVNRLKGGATILFIAHHVPRGLAVDEIVNIGVHEPARLRATAPSHS
jgi:subfamily B ATP-binding cassette protein HlyB/CyaB